MEPVLCCKVAVSAATYAIDKPYTYQVPGSFSDSLKVGMRVIVPFGRGNRKSEGIVLSLQPQEPGITLKSLSTLLDEEPVVDADGIRLALWMRERYFCTVYDCVKAVLPAGLYYNLQDHYRLVDGMTPEKAFALIQKQTDAVRILDLIQTNGGSISRKELYETFGTTDPGRALRYLMDQQVVQVETSAQRGVGDKTEELAMLAIPANEAQELVNAGRSKLRRAAVELLSNTGSASVKEIAYYSGAHRKTLKELEEMGVITLFRRPVFRRPKVEEVTRELPPELNEEQKHAYDGLCKLQAAGKACCSLLYGVTGSGKTSVYINLIHHTLEQDKTALVLVPEIGLTPQMLRQFTAQFGDQVAVLHSSLPAGERYDEWKRAKTGKASVVLGTRSAVFAPLDRLGLIILDEEQEPSYKSENLPRYHARDIAKFRCSQQNALLVLGSATPSVESRYFAQQDTYPLFLLSQRYNQQAMPDVIISDMKEELRAGNAKAIGRVLQKELAKNLERGEQSILFLNRRGASRMVLCAECGYVPECDRCSVKLTYHRANERLMCHYCGHSEPLPRRCPECGGVLTFVGSGTQQVEDELHELFPGTQVLRMDADTISASHTHQQLLQQFEQEKIPILLGTQMVAKGLDFANVTLVGVIDADLMLYVDDFRAGERTFSLLTQVVGRAGRGERQGRAVIQTVTPKNEIITTAARQDYDRFYESEIALRQLRRFPPFEDQFVLHVTGPEEGAVLRSSMRMRDGLIAWQNSPMMQGHPFQVLGPAPETIVKVNGRYRYRITVCGENNKTMRSMIAQLLHAASDDRQNRGLSVYADVNPLD